MTSLRVAFRTDASLDIGTGHVMRCLTLAESLRERGAECQFLCRAHPGNLIEAIRGRGFVTHTLPRADASGLIGGGGAAVPPVHASWLGTDWVTDAQETQAAIGDLPVDWLIADHYALDARWERKMRAVCRRIMVIDDLADRTHDADLLLDQNLGSDVGDYTELVPDCCRVLAGPRYALLRPEFAALRPYSLSRRSLGRLRRLLVTMGGVDKGNATGRVLTALTACRLVEDCRITVVMGSHAPWLEEVRTQASGMPWPTEVLVNVRDMATLMAESDLAIGAAGSTSWERCVVGLPAITVVLADNQRAVAQELATAGAVVLLDIHAQFALALQRHIESFDSDRSLLRDMSSRSSQICDGRGTALLTEALLAWPHGLTREVA